MDKMRDKLLGTGEVRLEDRAEMRSARTCQIKTNDRVTGCWSS